MKYKNRFSDLAINGGKPMFEQPLHVGRPNIGDKAQLLDRLNTILESRWFTNNGNFVQELEQRIADFLGVKHCLLICNGTIAMQIAAKALDLSGEIIVPAFTFVATAHAFQWQGITPIFCDIDPDTHCLDPQAVEKLITPKTCAVAGVQVWGQPCAIPELTEICDKHDIHLLYDAAHAFGCSHSSQMIGNFGDLEVFSFHATKFFHSFEGGAITTNNDELAQKIKWMRNFGFSGVDQVDSLGINGKMTEISAAMGLTQLEDLRFLVERNKQNYDQFHRQLSSLPGIKVFCYNEAEKQNFQYIVLEVDEAEAGVSRDFLVEALRAENILARRYFFPGCHHAEPYRSITPPENWDLPQTNELAQKTLILPTGSTVSEQEITIMCQIIHLVCSHAMAEQIVV